MSNSTVAPSRVEHVGRIAPRHPLSPADKAAHRAAEYRRGESAPLSPAAIRRLEEDLAWDLHNQRKTAGVA